MFCLQAWVHFPHFPNRSVIIFRTYVTLKGNYFFNSSFLWIGLVNLVLGVLHALAWVKTPYDPSMSVWNIFPRQCTAYITGGHCHITLGTYCWYYYYCHCCSSCYFSDCYFYLLALLCQIGYPFAYTISPAGLGTPLTGFNIQGARPLLPSGLWTIGLWRFCHPLS